MRVDRTTVRMFALAPAAPCRLASQAGASPAARLTAATIVTERARTRQSGASENGSGASISQKKCQRWCRSCHERQSGQRAQQREQRAFR